MKLGEPPPGVGRGRPAVGVLVEELQDQLLELAGNTGAQGGQRGRCVVEVLVEDLPARAGEGDVAGEQLVEEATERVEVAGCAQAGVAAGLLGRHVGGGADGDAGHGQGVVGGLDQARDAEVAQLRGVAGCLVKEDVGRLDVAVDDAAVVGVLQGLTDVDRPGQGLGDGERAPGERVQRPSDHEVHGQEKDSAAVEVGGAVVPDGDDVRVGQARGDLCLAAEGRFLYRVPLPYQDDLEGDVVGLVEVLSAPHSAHASAADRLLQPVPAGDRRVAHQVLQPCVSELWGRPAPGAVGKGVPRCGGAYENALPGRGGAILAPKGCPVTAGHGEMILPCLV